MCLALDLKDFEKRVYVILSKEMGPGIQMLLNLVLVFSSMQQVNFIILLMFKVFLCLNFFQTKTKPVHMMFLKDKFFILHETTMKFRIIELPYVENELSMFLLLPDDINDNTTGLELVKLTYCCIT